MSGDPFNYELVLLSYAQDGVAYDGTSFANFCGRIYALLDVFSTARRIMMDRLMNNPNRKCKCELPDEFRKCNCELPGEFRSSLLKAFSNETLYTFLMNDDQLNLDLFRADVYLSVMSFRIESLLTAFHNVRKLHMQLSNVAHALNINLLAYD